MFDVNTLSFVKKINPKNWTVVLNCGKDIELLDGTILRSFESGLFRNTEIVGEKLIAITIGNALDVSGETVAFCIDNWTPVFEIFPLEIFRNQEFYRSPKITFEDLTFNFWYCNENFSCGIHNKHDFFELHTQILGIGEMQKFHTEKEDTLFYRELLTSGKTHAPFFNKHGKYPYHQYKSHTKCIWLAIESNTRIP